MSKMQFSVLHIILSGAFLFITTTIPSVFIVLSLTTSTSTTGFSAMKAKIPQPEIFEEKYFRRLSLDPSDLDPTPTPLKLAQLHEAHLNKIPFENLAQHGAVGGPASLDFTLTSNKILDRNRGGFCFELNSLFASLLEQLGYSVQRIGAKVARGTDEKGRPIYGDHPTHVFLLVRDEMQQPWFVDVGFAEPPLHPLKYEYDIVQTTPEGMQSKLERVDDGIHAELLWGGGTTWNKRLQWKLEDLNNHRDLDDFAFNLKCVQREDCNFGRKIIVCRIDREQKVTLTGNKLKITGPPRFQEGGVVPNITILDSVDEVREVIEQKFGIVMEESGGLDLARSLEEESATAWASM